MAEKSDESPSKEVDSAEADKSKPKGGKDPELHSDSDSEDEASQGIVEGFLANLLRKNLALPTDKILDETSIDGIVKYIKDRPNIKIITMVGAGISTSAGIPDFRSPGTGIYNNLKKYNLPYTNAIFELKYFLENPAPFYQLAGEILPGAYQPTKAHWFIRLLQDKGLLLRHYSQNIDNLDRECGITEEKLVEAHGSFYKSHCTHSSCRKEFSFEWMRDKVLEKVIPKCDDCDHIVKPDIIFFGEALPKKFFENFTTDFRMCELLIIMGSSLAVEPFASLVSAVKRQVPRLMINAIDVGSKYDLKFSIPENGRDVLWIGECDRGCQILAEKLGWTVELEELINKNKPSSDTCNSQTEETSV